MTKDDFELYSSLSPEALQQLLGLGSIDSQDALLQDQLAQAQDFGKARGGNYAASPVGAAFGALGDVVRGVGGGIQQHNLMGQRSALIDQQKQGRSAYAAAMAEALKKKFGGQPVGGSMPGDAALLEPLAPQAVASSVDENGVPLAPFSLPPGGLPMRPRTKSGIYAQLLGG